MIKKVFLFCVLFFLINLTLNSQAGQSELKYPHVPAVSGEKIKLFTDRSIYCVNEKIYFTAEYSCITELDSLAWSNVLYVELIKWNGTRLMQMKLKLTRPGTPGNMKIPGNLLSGNYYLRAYTKWMRNYPVQEYAYQLVKIVNPFSSETDEGATDKSAPSGTALLKPVQKTLINGISCTLDKNEYNPGEKTEVSILINDRKLVDFDRYCVSVAKVSAVDTTGQYYESGVSSQERNLSFIEYLPEIRGITISGEVLDKSTKLSQKEAFVSLSETQHGEYFSVYQTDDLGRFHFSLPDITGQHDFFIQAEIPSDIEIDNGFCNKPVKLPYIAFKLDKDEIDFVKEMVINMQLSERFLTNKDTLADSKQTKAEPLVFYGSKKAVYSTEKYIELPNIEEFINEVVMEATIINEKGKASFINMRRTGLSDYQPLVFIDNVQVSNDDRLIKTPLNRIDRVELIDLDYIVGDMKYNGIISIYSRKKDFAGLVLNKNSTFFTYELFSEIDTACDFSPKSFDSRIPDRRNLLYWNPDVQLSADTQTTISFQTSDCKGEYIIYIRGKNSKEGNEIYGKCFFSVK
jgi:hypothetical protein